MFSKGLKSSFALLMLLLSSCGSAPSSSSLSSSSIVSSISTSAESSKEEKEKVILGSYPQSLVTDEGTIAQLSASKEIDEKGYIHLDDESYFPYETNARKEYNGGVRVDAGLHYFKVEPITWFKYRGSRVVSQYVLDATCFRKEFYMTTDKIIYYTDETKTHLAHEYVTSNLRSFLDGEFQSRAFDDLSEIVYSKVDNSSSTGHPDDKGYGASEDTYGYVYPLSYKEAFDYLDDYDRSAKVSDFAIARGVSALKKGNDLYSMYWLRTAHKWSDYVYAIDDNGECHKMFFYLSNLGARPALYLK